MNQLGEMFKDTYGLYEEICPIRLSGKKIIPFSTFLDYFSLGISMDLELIEIINLLLKLPGVSKLRKKNKELYLMIVWYQREKRNSQC